MGTAMIILSISAIIGLALALAAGFYLGWSIGRKRQLVEKQVEFKRDEALRENAQVDFEYVRDKADEIVSIANGIAVRARKAHGTVLKTHSAPGCASPAEQPSFVASAPTSSEPSKEAGSGRAD
jgi:hypothetical protein